MMTKLKMSATMIALVVVAALGYQYLSTSSSSRDEHDSAVLTVGFVPVRLPTGTNPVDIDVYVWQPERSGPQEYHVHTRVSPWSMPISATKGTKILFTAHRVGSLQGMHCQVDLPGKPRAAFDDKPRDGLVNCDLRVAA